MKLFKKSQLALLFPLLVVGCAGKGSFDTVAIEPQDLPNTSPSTSIPVPPSSEAEGQQVDPQIARHALGWSLDITQRNQAKYKADLTPIGKTTRKAVDDTEIQVDLEADEGRFPITLEKMKPNTGQFTPSRGFNHIYVGFSQYDDWADEIYEGPYGKEHKIYKGDKGTLRLQADKTINAMPQEGEFTYDGIWAYMTDIDTARRSYTALEQGGYEETGNSGGLNYSDSSESDSVKREDRGFGKTGHHATFKVHFGNKTLKGTLTREVQVPPTDNDTHEAFNIDARIVGSRFTGTAQANPRTPKGGAPRQQNDDFFKQQKASNVHGGFYGNQAQELAGGFLTDDQSMAVAFGAKRKTELAENTAMTHFIEGLRINIDNDEDFNPFSLNNLSGFKHLFVDGYNIPLANSEAFVNTKSIDTADGKVDVAYCCSPFEYLKLGLINHTSERHQPIKKYDNDYDDEYYEEDLDEANKYAEGRYFKDKRYLDEGWQTGNKWKYTPFNKSLFLQGEPSSQTPTEGKVKYQGSWQANIVHRNIPHSVTPDGFDEGARATFEADFGERKLTGQLWRANDVSNSPSVLIDANISGVTFEGKAKTGEYGINIDPERQLNNDVLRFSVPTKGLFYGPNASELGGSFSFSGISYKKDGEEKALYDKVGAVYGAKQVVEPK